MRPTPYVASLRVYEPIDAFNEPDQIRWRAISIQQPTGYEEQISALRRTISSDLIHQKPDGAHILELDGRRYVSPWSTAMRSWIALENFRTSLPESIISYFVPPEIEESIAITNESNVDRVPHIISETWMIPPRWFALFEPTDRIIGGNTEAGKNSSVFSIARTSIALAMERCEQAHQAVLGAFGAGPIENEIAELKAWLDFFHPQSIVELDYGGLAEYLEKLLKDDGFDGLLADTSIEDVRSSLAGLALGDGAMAGQGYERLVSRWRRIAALEQAM